MFMAHVGAPLSVDHASLTYDRVPAAPSCPPNKTSQNQAPHTWLGVTPPISESLPKEEDLIQTKNLVQLLDSFDVFEDEGSELSEHRGLIVNKLELLFQEWITEMCEYMNLLEEVKANARGKVLPFGSYRLRTHSKDADIDAVCIGPQILERKDFFSSFYEKLKTQEEIKYLNSTEGAVIPLLKFIFDGIEVGLVYTRLGQQSIPEDIDLLDDDIVKGMDPVCVRSLNGYRTTEEILKSVPDVSTFQLALRTIKLWAKRRSIYSHGMGFLGGVSWAILVARVCQMYPRASTSTVVAKFFMVYSNWRWPLPITLKRTVDPGFGFSVWNPRESKADRSDIMPVITPAYPNQNTTFNVTPSTVGVIKEEIKRGFIITGTIWQKKEEWSKLFETFNFVDQYKHFFVVELTSSAQEHHPKWVCLCASKIKHLVRFMEKNWQISQARVNLQSCPSQTSDGKITKRWLIGLVLNMDMYKFRNVDLDAEFQSYRTHVFECAKRSNMCTEDITLTGRYMRREDLTWLPDERKEVSRPVQHVSHAVVPQGTKTQLPVLDQTSTKRFKNEKEQSQNTFKESCPGSVLKEGKEVKSCPSPRNKKPRSPEPETTKQPKLDLPPEGSDASELTFNSQRSMRANPLAAPCDPGERQGAPWSVNHRNKYTPSITS
ncbi:poly(A) polymerase type 3-like [Cheilinus undulatus]|uniref:poly(A) polymerase type 3-like n=1 Tax=Cheilinus undulatus TaxID=241271 RepID=UPI001BD3FEBC|nr:poly(A) polymerase type 3-like [Cheilinus undulatus]